LPALAQSVSADLILHNGKIVTLDKRSSIAQAVAIRDGKFLAVGSDADVKRFSGAATKVIDLGGRTVVPGLNDSHTHFSRSRARRCTR
jgi:predicted amidohydrolase YtcJ